MIVVKKEPCDTRCPVSLSSCSERKAFRTSLVFRYESYCKLATWLVSLQRVLMSSFAEDFNAFRKVV